DAKQVLEEVDETLNDQLIPNLATTRTQISQVRTVLEDLRTSIEQLNVLPFVNLQISGDELLANIISGVDSLDSEIENVQVLAEQASVFISDTSYLLGGDFESTKQNLQNLLNVLEGYDTQLSNW